MSETTNNAITTSEATVAATPAKPKRKLKPVVKWVAGGILVTLTGGIILACLLKGKKPPTEVVNAATTAANTVADAATTAV